MQDQVRYQIKPLGTSDQEEEQERSEPMRGARAREVALKAAQAAGEILRAAYCTGATRVREKADTSLQTEADLAAEQAIISCVRAAFPDHTIESEEQGMSLGEAPSPYLWRIDPLDGTENFVLGLPYFSSTLTLCQDGQPLLAVVSEPLTGNLYLAEHGRGAWLNGERLHVSQTSQFRQCRAFFIPDSATKRQPLAVQVRHALYARCRRVLDTWSPALDWCLVASGQADLVIALANSPLMPNAGTLILQEAGGTITDGSGRPFTGQGQRLLVGSNSTELHAAGLRLLAPHTGGRQ
ncbi:MAG TPA: inositol monophosphatase family protein [Ktedonobacteraceae bacterium]|nr:inositol monophosphatase family protein [Ktedonobacteraceae bacterium]